MQLDAGIAAQPAAELPWEQSKHNPGPAAMWGSPRSSPASPKSGPNTCGKQGNAENGLQNQKSSQQIKQGTRGCGISADLERSNSISCTQLTPARQGARRRWLREGLGQGKTHRQKNSGIKAGAGAARESRNLLSSLGMFCGSPESSTEHWLQFDHQAEPHQAGNLAGSSSGRAG